MVRVDEFGLIKSVKIDPMPAKLIKRTAMKTVISMVALPKKSR